MFYTHQKGNRCMVLRNWYCAFALYCIGTFFYFVYIAEHMLSKHNATRAAKTGVHYDGIASTSVNAALENHERHKKVCCRALTPPCMACMTNTSVEEYCHKCATGWKWTYASAYCVPGCATASAFPFSDVPNEHRWRYDSSMLWAPRDTCGWPEHPPERPNETFHKYIAKVCVATPRACDLFKRTVVDTWDNALTWLKDGTAYVITGDISLMWLRDSVAQVTPYLHMVEHPSLQRLIEGVLRRAMVWIAMDPYGSSFRTTLDFDRKGKTRLTEWDFKCGRTIHVAQHDYEIDSLAYVVRLAHMYWKATGRTCWMGTQLAKTFERIVKLWILEQHHDRSSYTYPTLSNDGRGTKVCATGMTWGGMRPSDDKMTYHYNIPANMFASVALGHMLDMANVLWPDASWIKDATLLQQEIDEGIRRHGKVNGRYAYEVDGCGGVLFADDANVPSLLSAPYLGYAVDEDVYATTRKWILSSSNPWYASGAVLSGIGSPHSGSGTVWPLALVMEALTDDSSTDRVLDMVLRTSPHGLHESVSVDGRRTTRAWFGWANALFSEWMLAQTPPLWHTKKIKSFNSYSGLTKKEAIRLETRILKRLKETRNSGEYPFPLLIKSSEHTLTTSTVGTSLDKLDTNTKAMFYKNNNVSEQVKTIVSHLEKAHVRHLDIQKCGNWAIQHNNLHVLDFDIATIDGVAPTPLLRKMSSEFQDNEVYATHLLKSVQICLLGTRVAQTPVVESWSFRPNDKCPLYQWYPEKDGFKLQTGGRICVVENLVLDTRKISVPSGGEDNDAVRGRLESDEFPTYDTGTWVIPKPSLIQTMVKGVVVTSLSPTRTSKYLSGHTLFINRVEYANLWHTMLDWMSTWDAIARTQTPTRIVWLDGHARGTLDDVWSQLFGAKNMYVSELPLGSLVFEKVTFVMGKWNDHANNAIYPTSHAPRQRSCLSTMMTFVKHVLQAYNLTWHPTHDTIIDRRPYDAHPRVRGMSRTLGQMERIRAHWPEAKVVDLATMSFGEQLQLMVRTKTLRGVHGAGITHLMFLPPGATVVEWVPTSHAHIRLFETLASWRPDITYVRQKVHACGDDWCVPGLDMAPPPEKHTTDATTHLSYAPYMLPMPHFVTDLEQYNNQSEIFDKHAGAAH